ncbi:NRDE family protein [Shewanella sp. WXL01]|uniref:NRDE family protein n=1 Tax=Shewanella sp. WXL01 TaxID=2709721 RepID=UPI00143859FE|nr:NRDE family protein [Shewanella sp. WXL01]NKF52554.1 NRDE family protein [Shewanella sp. WXL01]
MCILFIAVDTHPKYPLIVCANRDEFHHRPTQAAQYWQADNTDKRILAGRDLQAGGTWLGVSETGQFAGLTNIRTAQAETHLRSRGELVVNALVHQLDHQWLTEHAALYSPFNLIYEQQQTLFCFNSQQQTSIPLTKGFHAISNGALDEKWPKMAKGEQALEQLIKQQGELDINQLIEIMLDNSTAKDELLPQTGISLEWERLLSSIFIKHAEYGTRSTSVLLRDKCGSCSFTERRYDGKGRNLGQQTFSLTVTP